MIALDATEISQRFAAGSLRPSQYLDACLARVQVLDEDLGICNELAADAMSQAQAADARWQRGEARSPFDGVPFGVKVNIAVRGLCWTAGIAAFRNRRAEADSGAVERLRGAGMIPLATLNMHEAAFGATSQNPAFRNTCNPHAPAHIPGGSSGGSSAAVAAGLLPVALGTDDLGSVRLPSGLCGVVGYKPAHGTISTDGVVPLSPRLDHVGVHARSVRDVMRVMALFGEAGSSAHQSLLEWQTSVDVDPAVRRATRCATDGMVSWVDVDLGRVRRAGLVLCELDGGQEFESELQAHPEGFSDGFRRSVAWAQGLDEAKVAASMRLLDEIAARLKTDAARGLLVSPTTPCVAPRRAVVPPENMADLTGPAAIAGLPSISVPSGKVDGLPVGLMLTGTNGTDVLEAAERLFPRVAAIGGGV